MAKLRAKSAVRYFLGKSFMRDGFIRVSVYPKRPEIMKKVFEALKSAGYTECDRQTWMRLRGDAQKQIGTTIM